MNNPLLFGPFETEEEAYGALDDYLTSEAGIDSAGLAVAAKHAAETMEADAEHYPGNELAKRRFQVAVKAFAHAVGQGNPPAAIVGMAAASLFVWLCAAYPTAGYEVFRRIGNDLRQLHKIPDIAWGEEPTYEQ